MRNNESLSKHGPVDRPNINIWSPLGELKRNAAVCEKRREAIHSSPPLETFFSIKNNIYAFCPLLFLVGRSTFAIISRPFPMNTSQPPISASCWPAIRTQGLDWKEPKIPSTWVQPLEALITGASCFAFGAQHSATALTSGQMWKPLWTWLFHIQTHVRIFFSALSRSSPLPFPFGSGPVCHFSHVRCISICFSWPGQTN